MDTIKIKNRDDVIAAVNKYKGKLPFCWIMTKNADGLFSNIQGLISIAGIKAQVVNSANRMFAGCKYLTEVPNLYLDKVVNADYLFDGCLAMISGPKLELKAAVSLRGLYQNCSSLVNSGEIKAPIASDITKIFFDCSSLKNVNLNVGTLRSTNNAFKGCTHLNNWVDLNLSSVFDASYMYDSSGITEVPDIDFANALNLDCVFYSCSKLVNVGKINAPKVKSIWSMFGYCNRLTSVGEIFAPNLEEDYSVDNIKKYVFEGCRDRDKLTKSFLGSKITTFSSTRNRLSGAVYFSIKKLEHTMNIGKSIKKLQNFAADLDDKNDDLVEEAKENLLSGDDSLVQEGLKAACGSFKVHDALKSNGPFMKSLKEKAPKAYEDFQKYSGIIEKKRKSMPTPQEEMMDDAKKLENLNTMKKVGDALKGSMEEPLASLFENLMQDMINRGASAIALSKMKDDETGLSLVDEAASLSKDGGASLKSAGVEVDDEAVAKEKEAIEKGESKSAVAAAGAVPMSVKAEGAEASSVTPETVDPDIEVKDEKSARELGESLAMMVHGTKFDQAIFDDIFQNCIKKHQGEDGTDWSAVAAHLRNIYRAANHVTNFSRILKKISK